MSVKEKKRAASDSETSTHHKKQKQNNDASVEESKTNGDYQQETTDTTQVQDNSAFPPEPTNNDNQTAIEASNDDQQNQSTGSNDGDHDSAFPPEPTQNNALNSADLSSQQVDDRQSAMDEYYSYFNISPEEQHILQQQQNDYHLQHHNAVTSGLPHDEYQYEEPTQQPQYSRQTEFYAINESANGGQANSGEVDSSKPYRCDYPDCDKGYKKMNGLISHHYGFHTSITPNDPKPYKCGYPGCNKAYRNTNGLAYHIENSHVDDGPIQSAKEPGTFYPSEENIRLVNVTESGSGSASGDEGNGQDNTSGGKKQGGFPCPYVGCDKVYKNSNGLSYHLSKGKLCGHKHEKSGTLSSSTTNINSEPSSAATSPNAKKENVDNLGDITYSGNFKCAVCLADYSDYKELMAHMSGEHNAVGGVEMFELQGPVDPTNIVGEEDYGAFLASTTGSFASHIAATVGTTAGYHEFINESGIQAVDEHELALAVKNEDHKRVDSGVVTPTTTALEEN